MNAMILNKYRDMQAKSAADSFEQLARAFRNMCVLPKEGELHSRAQAVSNRLQISGELEAMAQVLRNLSEVEKNVDGRYRRRLSRVIRFGKEIGLRMSEVHIWQDARGHLVLTAEVEAKRKKEIPLELFCAQMWKATGIAWRYAKEEDPSIYGDSRLIALYEDTKYQVLTGIAAVNQKGKNESGDCYSVFEEMDGCAYLGLSDGMGTGKKARHESGMILNLWEQLVQAGLPMKSAVRLLNSAMILRGEQNVFSTLDVAEINLYDGTITMQKLGAPLSFIKRKDSVEMLWMDSLPIGVLEQLLETPINIGIKDGEFLVMLTDGVVEYMQSTKPEQAIMHIIAEIETKHAQTMANEIMDRVLNLCEKEAVDDMTILVAGIWDKNVAEDRELHKRK